MLNYSHTNDRPSSVIAEPGINILPLYLKSDIGMRRWRSALRPSCHWRPGMGDGMEPNRPVACFVKCHVDGRR